MSLLTTKLRLAEVFRQSGDAANHKKTIITRSGCKMQFDDADGAGSITVTDPSGNTWYMDGAGNINVTAPKNMTFTIGNDFNITVGNNMSTSIGKDNSTTVEKNNTLTVLELHKLITTDYKQTVSNNKDVAISGDLKETTSTTTHKATKGDVLIQSAGVATVLGKIDAKVNKG